MKKVVVISSSPRKGGNTDLMCDEFVKGAVEAGCAVEKISLAGKKIGCCLGCYACKDSHVCIQKDNARAIIDKMQAADVIVLATPVYFYTMSAQLKALIDRHVVTFPDLANKEFFFLMAMADTGAEKFHGTIAALRGFLDCYDGSVERGRICAEGVYEKGDITSTDYLRQSYTLGKSV